MANWSNASLPFTGTTTEDGKTGMHISFAEDSAAGKTVAAAIVDMNLILKQMLEEQRAFQKKVEMFINHALDC